jgi:hypothetical protein
MSAVNLLTDLIHLGFSLAAEGDSIRVRPASQLTEDLRQAIRANKTELLAIISSPAAVVTPLRPSKPSAAPLAPWDAAEASRLLEELRFEIQRIESVDFRGRPPGPLHNVLADALAIAQVFIANHELEAARGWDALKLLRGVIRRVRRYRKDSKPNTTALTAINANLKRAKT